MSKAKSHMMIIELDLKLQSKTMSKDSVKSPKKAIKNE